MASLFKKKQKAEPDPEGPTADDDKVEKVEKTPEPEPEKATITFKKTVVEDPTAKVRVLGKKTVSALVAGHNIQVVAGKHQMVPASAVSDLKLTGCIH